MKNKIIILVLSILVVLLTGYIIYDKTIESNEKTSIKINDDTLKKDSIITEETDLNNNETDISEENNKENNLDNPNTSNEINNIELKTYESIITNDLSYLLGKNSLSELTNQDILRMLFEIYKTKNGFPKSFTKTDLNNIHKNSVLKNLEIIHENISDYSIVYNYNESPLFDYNNDTYTYAKTGHQYESVKIINKELVEKTEKDGEIILSYKFVFLKQSGNLPTYLKLYYTIDDIKNNKSFKEYSYYDITDEASYAITLDNAKTYIKDSYDTIKENLKIYTYTFKIENNNIILKDFYVK